MVNVISIHSSSNIKEHKASYHLKRAQEIVLNDVEWKKHFDYFGINLSQ